MTLAATMWHPDGWGSRARMGLLTPHNDIVPEGEFRALAPDDVSIHVARVPLGWRSGPEPPPIGLDAVAMPRFRRHQGYGAVRHATSRLSFATEAVLKMSVAASGDLIAPFWGIRR